MNQNFKYLCLSIAFILHPEINAQTGAQNFVLSHSYKQKGATIGLDKVNTNIQYLDGLGRPIQTIHMGQAPNGDDAIVPIIYDIYGRQLLNYLPYTASTNSNFQANSSTSQLAYYANNTLNLQGDDTGRPFSESIVENSPQNRSLGMQEPGINSNTSVNIFESNITNEVKRYDAPLTENGIYALGELTKLKITDENGKITESFTDKEGQIICKKVINGLQSLDTYYVYDDNNRLVTVLQPEYQTTANANYFAFQYQYDERSRLIAKKIPGAGWQYMVYDTFDRLRFSQDANQLTRGVWHFVKYDADNRIAYSGEIISNKLQSELKQNLKDNPAHHETRMTSGLGYSLGNSFPAVTDSDIYNETFYDNYTGFAENYINDYGIAQRTNVVGQVTGSRTKILGTNTKLISVIFYDDEYRIIQSVKELYNLGGRKERNSIKYLYDLAPVVAEQKMIQFGTSLPTNSLIKTFTYDHTDRPLNIQESVSIGNSSKTAFTQAYRYNALGQQTQKWTHSADGINYLHRTDQYYNIRGWLTEGNSIFKTDGTEKRHFGYLLDYLNGNKYTNGNIAAMYLAETNEFGYNKGIIFGYDGANRLTSNTGISGYTDLEPTVNYDKNGNIQNLTRTGQSAGTYIYNYNGNQINTVNSKSYAYDGNGNTITDGIRSLNLTYNYLNLTSSVSGLGISQTYVFDANGQKQEFTSGATTTKYAGAFEYDASNNVTRVAITDGQAIINNGAIKYQYYHKDHLGNVRSMIDETGKSLQRTDYYPFGLDITRVGNSITNKYLYNGKEKWVGSGYLDYGARFYDSMAPHFLSVDPLASKWDMISSYNYTINNPIRYIDPDGRDVYNINSSTGEIEITKTENKRHSYHITNGDGNHTFIGSYKYNSNGLIKLPSSIRFDHGGNEVGFSVKKGNENKSYVSGNAFASLIGTVANSGVNDLTVNQFSKSDGTSPDPSKSHKRGRNGDLRYLRSDESGGSVILGSSNVDISRQNQLNNALYLFGWKDMISERFNGGLLNHVSSAKERGIKSDHSNHLHLQGYSPNVQIDYFGGILPEVVVKPNNE